MDILVNYDYRGPDVKAALDVDALAALVLAREGLPDNAEGSISFVTDEEIHRLNRDFRDVDRPTDVLSFECDNLDDEFCGLSGDEPYELGDIVVAVDVAERQAPEYGMSFSDELSLLVTHGLLHLCGWDHMEPEEAEAMEARERELLSEFWGREFRRFASDGASDGERA